jgi:hypothetical protein
MVLCNMFLFDSGERFISPTFGVTCRSGSIALHGPLVMRKEGRTGGGSTEAVR